MVGSRAAVLTPKSCETLNFLCGEPSPTLVGAHGLDPCCDLIPQAFRLTWVGRMYASLGGSLEASQVVPQGRSACVGRWRHQVVVPLEVGG